MGEGDEFPEGDMRMRWWAAPLMYGLWLVYRAGYAHTRVYWAARRVADRGCYVVPR